MVEISCVFDGANAIGEGAFWDAVDQKLWWVDIPAGHVFRLEPETGHHVAFGVNEPVGCLAPREAGGLVLATKSGFYLFDPATGTKTLLVDPEPERPLNRFNDGTTDPRGRFWAGSMRDAPPPAAEGAFYRLGTDHRCWRWRDGIFTTNGLAFGPDGRTMYFSDSFPEVRTIWAADYDVDDGVPTNVRPFFDTRTVAGRPDGATVDADGCYWMAGVGGWQLVRLTPAGAVDRIVDMPVERPSKPMFGGADLDILYVTSIGQNLTPGTEARQPQAGGLFAVTGLGCRGLPQPRFAG
jgi:sugar lactone lactonase YvrE